MAATAPAHYIRSIHTSFTAAHPRNSSSWANAASNAAAPRYAPHLPSTQKDKDMLVFQQQQPQQQYTQYQTGQHHHHQLQYNHPPSISTHNSHTYTHHLYAASSAAVGGGAPFPAAAAAAAAASAQGGMAQERGYAQGGLRKGPAVVGGAPTSGRRRSASIRMPPSYTHQRGRSSPAYKFDPFADDEAPSSPPLSVTTPLTSSSQANRGAPTPELEVVSQNQHQQQYQHTAPYTIHIPAAQPTEIQQYTPPPPSPRPAARTTVLRSLTPINGPLPGTAPTTASKAGVQGRQAAQSPPNLSKIVAGILLNRVHAVGKPMRRRVMPHLEGEKGYRKSCLSSVVSVEA